MTDLQLMEALQRDDPEAMQELVERFGGRLSKCLLGWTGNREDAMDLTQEVLVRVHQKASLYNAKAPLAPWIFRIARNLFYDQRRRRNYRVHSEASVWNESQPPVDSGLESPEESLMRRQLVARIQQAISSLPRRQREVIQLRLLGELKLEEIAQILDLSLGGVKSTLHNGLRSLRERLAELRSEIHG